MYSVLAQKEKIIAAWRKGDTSFKRRRYRQSRFPKLEAALMEWFREMRSTTPDASISHALQLVPHLGLKFRRGCDWNVANGSDCRRVLDRLFALELDGAGGEWQACILVQTPYSVAIDVRPSTPSLMLFDSHKPVVAISGHSASVAFMADLVQHFIEVRLSTKLKDGNLCVVTAV